MSNALNWFEIPASDIKRAARFYGTILGAEGENGFFAHFLDTEGNKVGVHSMG